MKYLILILSLIFFGCASSPKQECSSMADEPVSACRAEAACHRGIWGSIGIVLGGIGQGLSHSSNNQAADAHQDCLDRNLRAQASNVGISSETANCKAVQISDDKYKVTCQ